MTLRDALHAIFRRRLLIAIVPVVAVLLAWAVMLAQPTRYESHARFMVLPWPTTAMDTAFAAATGQRERADARDLETEVRLLEGYRLPAEKIGTLSDVIHQARVERGGLSRALAGDTADFEELSERWSSITRFERIPGTDLIEARFRWEEPYVALSVAESFVDSYLDHRAGIAQPAATPLAVPAIAQERAAGFTWDDELHAIDAELAGLKLKREHVDAQARQGGWIDTPDLGDGANDLTRLDGLYYELRAERDRLAQLYKSDARAVVEMDARLASLRRQKLASVRSILGLRNKALADGRERIVERREQWAATSAGLPAVSSGAASSLPPISLVVRPTVPEKPAPRVRVLTLFWTALAALAAAVAAALLMHRFDQKLTRAEDLEDAAGVPVLATIPMRKGV